MAKLMERLEYVLHFFGYAKDERDGHRNEEVHVGPNGVTYTKLELYDYEGKAKTENKAAYMDYLNVNEKMLNMRINEKVTGKFSEVTINKENEGFSMLTEKDMIYFSEVIPMLSIKEDVKRI